MTKPATPSRHVFEQIYLRLHEAAEATRSKLSGIKKLEKVLKDTQAKLEELPWPFAETSKLIADLERLSPDVHAGVEVSSLITDLKTELHAAAGEFQSAFLEEIGKAATEAHVACGKCGSEFFVGPFELSIDRAKGQANLSYAKQCIAGSLPLVAEKIVAAAVEMTSKLLNPPVETSPLAVEFEQAIRVVLVRDRKPAPTAELRASLPNVYREMVLIRQDRDRPLSAQGFREYPLARFIVELKTLIQSNENITAKKRFRLEIAVIDNTRNAKKSIFIPNDLAKGYGEGSYFQAILLLAGE